MNKNILNTINQEFINLNLDSNIHKLLFKKHTFKGVTIVELVNQIEAKKKCKTKLPNWFHAEQIYYPNKLNIEQTSSEITARYKSGLVSGSTLIDITGGFGVDSFYFSNTIKHVTHCEVNHLLSEIARHNFFQLNKEITCISDNGLTYLENNGNKYDWIYVDPSRRHDSKGKVFFLNDCEPNLVNKLDTLFNYSDNILVKTSPLLDISIGLKELSSVKEIHIVAVNNEVKELLWVLDKNCGLKHPEIKTINIKKDTFETFNFYLNEEEDAVSSYSEPNKYLYEPNSTIMKSGAFKLISERLKIKKLQLNTHLYTSDKLIEFPGRSFKIKEVIPYNKKAIKQLLGGIQANVATRNFPETVASIKKQLKIKDGGNKYVFFTTKKDHKKVVLICFKI